MISYRGVVVLAQHIHSPWKVGLDIYPRQEGCIHLILSLPICSPSADWVTLSKSQAWQFSFLGAWELTYLSQYLSRKLSQVCGSSVNSCNPHPNYHGDGASCFVSPLHSPICPSPVSTKLKGPHPSTADSRASLELAGPSEATVVPDPCCLGMCQPVALVCTADTTQRPVTRATALDYKLKIWNCSYTKCWKMPFKSPRPFVHSVYVGCKCILKTCKWAIRK